MVTIAIINKILHTGEMRGVKIEALAASGPRRDRAEVVAEVAKVVASFCHHGVRAKTSGVSLLQRIRAHGAV